MLEKQIFAKLVNWLYYKNLVNLFEISWWIHRYPQGDI